MAVGFAVLLTVGCGQGPQAQFSVRDTTEELLSPAQKAVKKALDDGFGTPHELVAWQRLPVNYGGVHGAVGEVLADGKGITAKWEGDAAGVTAGAPLLWISGARAAESTSVDSVGSFDAKTKTLTWSGAAEPAPAAGDKLVIGFGQTLKTGRMVYMKNCMHCHGVAGDGAGPTAKYLNPLPRDYRSGVFKFTSTLTPEKPTRDDLTRVVKYGIPGTYMPSFLWLGGKETESVVEYVRWLSMRGEFEKRLDDDLSGDFSQKAIEESAEKALAEFKAAKADEKPEKPRSAGDLKKEAVAKFTNETDGYEKTEFPGVIDDTANFLAQGWTHGEDPESLILPSVPRVPDDAASRERGRRMYLSDKGKCYTCHGIQGRGDGAATEDFWKKPGSDEVYERRGLHDAWGHPLMPRNLTLGQYRGGRRPLDVFRRIYAGIKGTPMPGFGRTALKDEEIWDVVNFVMSLQYQSAPAPAKPAEHVAESK
ncbi:MAG: cytochrome c [Planctomycetes bacterium]|nr:cytochrome c [Planctomycetota bacterium]